MRVRAGAAVLAISMVSAATAQRPALSEQDRTLARDVFRELIEINSQDSNGSVTAAAEAMRNRLLKAGFAASDLVVAGPNDRKKNLVARYRGNGRPGLKPILIIGHLDVVEARREDWSTDPYKFLEKDGYFYGRGTQDMKGDDAVIVTNFIRLKRDGWVPSRDLVLALTADEEGGQSNGVDWLLRNKPELMQAEFVLNPDAGGVKLMDGKAQIVGVEATEKLYADYHVTATNPGGHSSAPRPDNAIYELMHALENLEAHPFPVELNAVTRSAMEAEIPTAPADRAKILRGLLAEPMDQGSLTEFIKRPGDNAMLRTTCVATMLKGGHAPNALPGMAQANVNCRILPGHSQEEVRRELIRIFSDSELKVEYVADDGTVSPKGSEKKSMAPPPLRQDVMLPLREVVQQMWPGVPIIPSMSAGASDSIYTMAAGVPSYGISGMGVDANDSREHGRDERVRVTAFYDDVEFYYLYLKAVAGN